MSYSISSFKRFHIYKSAKPKPNSLQNHHLQQNTLYITANVHQYGANRTNGATHTSRSKQSFCYIKRTMNYFTSKVYYLGQNNKNTLSISKNHNTKEVRTEH